MIMKNFRHLFLVLFLVIGLSGVYGQNRTIEMNDSILYTMLVEKGVKEPVIVLSQAKIETGNYKSNLCVNFYNLFGIKRNGRYAHYTSFDECIDAYLNKIQYKYREGKETYYQFLKRIRYAESPTYISKVMKMAKTIKL